MSRNCKYHNPEEGLVYNPDDYVYGSARDYRGEKGLLDDVIKLIYLIEYHANGFAR